MSNAGAMPGDPKFPVWNDLKIDGRAAKIATQSIRMRLTSGHHRTGSDAMMDMQSIPPAIVEAIEAGIPVSKAFRIFSDQSISELAEATHLEAGRICMIEAGSVPTRSEAEAMGEVLDIPTPLIDRSA